MAIERDFRVKHGANIASTLTVQSTAQSISSVTGAIQVVGGVGIGGNLIVDGNQRTAGVFTITNTTQANSSLTGALQVGGGIGVQGNVYIHGILSVSGGISAAITGTITTATNISGGTAGQVPYQSSPGNTQYFGPGTAGQVLISGGTNGPSYTNTSSFKVGYATYADQWTNPRTITLSGDLSGNVSIDGSNNVTLTATVVSDSVALGTDTTGIYVASGATSGFGLSGSTSSEGGVFTVSSNGTSSNTTSTLVFRNASGNFSAGTITANLIGNVTGNADYAVAAGRWDTAKTLTLAGDLSGSASFDGSSNFTLTATVTTDAVALGTDTTGIYVATGAVSGFGLSGSANTEGSTFTVTANSTSSNTTSTIVYRDGSGNFSASTITANITGNVTGNLTGTATSATNISGGTSGQLPYQSAIGQTGFLGPGTAGQILVSQGASSSGPAFQNT